MIKIGVIKGIAKKEFLDTIRDRWTLAIATIFGIVSTAISYFGLVFKGETGLQNFEVTITSLVTLVLYLVPLVALLLGYSAISGEREQGSLAVVLVQPLSRRDVVLGKFVGLAMALATATVLGFGVTGILIAWRAGSQGWLDYLYFLLTSVVLGLVFLSIGLLISALSRKKARSAVGAIFIWFFFTFIYDLALLGLLMTLSPYLKASWLAVLMILNPGDVFRLANLWHLEKLRETMGLAALVSPGLLNGELLAILFLTWIIVPLGITISVFRGQDI